MTDGNIVTSRKPDDVAGLHRGADRGARTVLNRLARICALCACAMSMGHDAARLDWLVELAAGIAPALAALVAAVMLAPSFELAAAGGGAWRGRRRSSWPMLAMRAVPAEPRALRLARLRAGSIADANCCSMSPTSRPSCCSTSRSRSLRQTRWPNCCSTIHCPQRRPIARVVQLFAGQPNADRRASCRPDRPASGATVAARPARDRCRRTRCTRRWPSFAARSARR